MKALLLNDIGKLEIIERPVPSLESNHVLVAVKACGICGSDIPRAYTDGAHHMPIVLGHEFAGVVKDVSADVDKSWLNKRVGVFPLLPCMKCSQCRKQHYEMCENYSYLGSRTDGGFAEYVSVPSWNLIELPDNVTYEQAAMLEPLAVVAHAIRKPGVRPDERVAVIGLGAICILGNPRQDMNIPKEIYWKILRKQLKLVGSWNSSFTHNQNDDWHFILSILGKEENNTFHPEQFITHKFDLERIKDGFEIMRLKQEPYVKIMMVAE